MNVKSIVEQFQANGQVKKIASFGGGHINHTYRVYNEDPQCPDYLLQRINHEVFTDVPSMMDNIQRVVAHLAGKDDNYKMLALIPLVEGGICFRTPKGEYWRMFTFINSLASFEVAENPEQIYEGAKAFGNFLYHLSDFPTDSLHLTIPDFHNVISRLNIFRKAVEQDSFKRAAKAAFEIQYAWKLAEEMSAIQKTGKNGKIPLRVTHNDTKFNNVLLHCNGGGGVVIDLDTVMPGYVHFDFGDGIRTTASVAREDEPDLSKIQVDIKRTAAFINGYLEGARDILTSIEIQYLPFSGALMAYIMGVRFLTDYLSGDVYYKTSFEEQNFQRAKAQLDLAKKLLERKADIEKLV